MSLGGRAVLEQDAHAWDGLLADARTSLSSRRIFFTGATGFIGKWTLESLLYFSRQAGVPFEIVALSREPERFRSDHPHLAALPGLSFINGDVRTFTFPDGRFDIVIHGAVDARAAFNASAPLGMFDTVAQGTRRVLDFCASASAATLLLLSSGAVYGRQPPDIVRVAEDHLGGPDVLVPGHAYAEGKRVAELLSAQYAQQCGFQLKIARCFSFVGPYLPLDVHFAIGNFIGDALASRRIRVMGDGRAVRSYLYASDLVGWLWRILFDGVSGRAYNVGSEDCIDIAALANLVGSVAGLAEGVEILGASSSGEVPHRFVPSTWRARTELSLEATVPLDEAIRRTIEWHRRGGA